ncbi:MAG: hypothetical protein IJU61_00145 [Victivallales bacterium]|nr:hypothetical protein [Victivallales bacterium]
MFTSGYWLVADDETSVGLSPDIEAHLLECDSRFLRVDADSFRLLVGSMVCEEAFPCELLPWLLVIALLLIRVRHVFFVTLCYVVVLLHRRVSWMYEWSSTYTQDVVY